MLESSDPGENNRKGGRTEKSGLPDATIAWCGTPGGFRILEYRSRGIEVFGVAGHIIYLDPTKSPPQLIVVESIQEAARTEALGSICKGIWVHKVGD